MRSSCPLSALNDRCPPLIVLIGQVGDEHDLPAHAQHIVPVWVVLEPSHSPSLDLDSVYWFELCLHYVLVYYESSKSAEIP